MPSRRDDLEAAGLMFIHLLTPRGLTWTRNGVPKTEAAHDRLIAEKQMARPEDLCRGIPVEFEDFLRYTRKLKFEQCPDYAKWIETFKNLAIENGYSGKDDFIWPAVPPVVRIDGFRGYLLKLISVRLCRRMLPNLSTHPFGRLVPLLHGMRWKGS